MKKFFLIILLIISILPIGNFSNNIVCSSGDKELKIRVNGEILNTDVSPVIIDDRALVPARAVFEKLGAKVDWIAENNEVSISYLDKNIKLTIDSKNAIVNGNTVEMEVPAKIINERTFIPVRFVGEQLNMVVGWQAKKNLITIDDPSKLIINHECTDIGEEVSMILSQYNNYNIFRLSDPERIVIDIPNACAPDSLQTIDVNSLLIKTIRYIQSDDNNSVRVVLDVNGQPKYNVKEETGKLVLELSSNFNRIVVIDPGHGGNDSGAVYGGVNEKDLNLAISLKLNELLKDKGVKVYLTRTEDKTVGLYERTDFANNLNASLFLSVHNNAYMTSSRGTETLYYPNGVCINSVTGKTFAQTVQNNLVKALGTVDRGIIERPNLAVLRTSKMPAALAEVGFMTNSAELEKLKDPDFQQKAAQALCDAVISNLVTMN